MRNQKLPIFGFEKEKVEISTFSNPEFKNLSKRKILNKIRYTLENFAEDNIHSIKIRQPEVYDTLLTDFEEKIKNIPIKQTSEEIKNEITKLNPSIDRYSLAFYTSLYLIHHQKSEKILLFEKTPLIKNIFEIKEADNTVLLFKLIEKGKLIYICHLNDTSFTKRFKKTMFYNSEVSLKTLIFSTYKFFLNLPYYTKNTQNLSKDAKKLLTLFSENSNPYKTITKNLPSAFGINPENFTENEYKDFEKRFIVASKELKYKIDNLKEEIKNTFLNSFGSENIEKIRKSISPFSSSDREVLAVENALKKENWIDLISIIFSEKAVIDLSDDDVQELIKRIKLFHKKIDELEELYLEKQENPQTMVVKLQFYTSKKSIKKIEKINREKYENQPLPEIDTSNLTKEQKIKLIQKLIKEI